MPESVEILAKQTANAYHWVNKLIDSIPLEKWEEIPPVIESNVIWQMGHLLTSFYFHSIVVIVGHQMDIIQKMPLKQYGALFTTAPASESSGKINLVLLREHLNLMQQKSMEIIQALPYAELNASLEPSQIPHPIAQTKWEALDWNIKHSMYHCGQLGVLKRVLDTRFDFGLKFK